MPAGLHIVRKVRPHKPTLYYVYAWRGGPCIHKCEAIRPKITAALTDAAALARQKRVQGDRTLSDLIINYRSPQTPEWAKLAKSTKANRQTWLTRIQDKFGKVPLEVFNDRRMRGDILKWRDTWIEQPRSADMAMEAFSRILSWAVDRGKLATNILSGISSLYDVDRSDIIWEPKHYEAFFAKASVEVREGVELATCTGLRRGDLIEVPWSAVGDHAIIWQTNKSRGRNRIVIPLLPEAKALLARIKARWESEQLALAEAKRRPLPETILSNSRWQPWTASGFGSRFNDAKQESGIEVNLHDTRGTFATRCMVGGLTDQEIADILGWNTKDVANIRVRYVDQARVVRAIGERISKASVN